MPSESIVPWMSWRNPGLVLVGVLSLVGLAAFLSSCSLFQAVFPPAAPTPRPFNHEAHTVRGIACGDCHEGAEKEVHAGMPAKAFCMTCHEELDKEKDKPIEKKVAWFQGDDGEVRWADFGKQKDDIKFSHAAHAGKVSCTACHLDMDKNTGLVPHGPQRMTACTACHQQNAPTKQDCSVCHVATDRLKKPENHFQLWTKNHGPCSREGVGVATANNCSLCHQPETCVTCHHTVLPQDHTDFWRLRTHGLAAGLDRSRCQTCHTTDSCVACHQVAAPLSHRGGWNAPLEQHCRNCHLPLQTSGSCAVCHRDTPGHLTSPPKPPWHTPQMVCTTCHAATLKHPDNGDNCNSCHH